MTLLRTIGDFSYFRRFLLSSSSIFIFLLFASQMPAFRSRNISFFLLSPFSSIIFCEMNKKTFDVNRQVLLSLSLGIFVPPSLRSSEQLPNIGKLPVSLWWTHANRMIYLHFSFSFWIFNFCGYFKSTTDSSKWVIDRLMITANVDELWRSW